MITYFYTKFSLRKIKFQIPGESSCTIYRKMYIIYIGDKSKCFKHVVGYNRKFGVLSCWHHLFYASFICFFVAFFPSSFKIFFSFAFYDFLFHRRRKFFIQISFIQWEFFYFVIIRISLFIFLEQGKYFLFGLIFEKRKPDL